MSDETAVAQEQAEVAQEQAAEQTSPEQPAEETTEQPAETVVEVAPARLLISNIGKLYIQEQNETVFDIQALFYVGDDLIEERRFNYPLVTTIEELKSNLAQELATYNTDRQQAAQNKASDEANKVADETIDALTGSEILPDGEVKPGQTVGEVVSAVTEGENAS